MIAAFVSKEAMALSHILWIGGPPDCGKTTVADLLGSTYQLQVYHFDRYEMDHIRRADPERHPALFALGTKLADLDEKAFLEWLWLSCTPAEMAASGKSVWVERLHMVIEDLHAMSADRPIIAEGPGFFPEALLPLLPDPQRAIWMVPSEPFKRDSHHRRLKGQRRAEVLDDPELAQRNHIERDLLWAEQYRQSAKERGLPLIEVDGSKGPEEVAAEVEAYFKILLPPPNQQP